MPKLYDEPCRLNDEINPRCHYVRRGSRIHYPFKAMIKGDYFVLDTLSEVAKARAAMHAFLKSKRYTHSQSFAQFTIRPPRGENPDGIWICRRVR